METPEKTKSYKYITPWPKIHRDKSNVLDCGPLIREVDEIPKDFASREWIVYVKENFKTLGRLVPPYHKHFRFNHWTNYVLTSSNIKYIRRFLIRANMLDKAPDQFDPEAWQEYVDYSVQIGARYNTVQIMQKALKRYFEWLYKHQFCQTDYSKFIFCDHNQFNFGQLKKKTAKAITPEMFNRMIAAIPERQAEYRLLVTLGYHTGMRLQDILLLTSENVDWQDKKVTTVARKNGEYHESLVPSEVITAMRDTMDRKTGSILPGLADVLRRDGTKNISSRIRDYFDKAKCYGYSMHDFRRTKIMQGQVLGKTAEELASSLGHKRVSTTLSCYIPMDLESQTFIEFNQAARQLQAIDSELSNYGHRRSPNAGTGGLGAYHESVSITSPEIPDDGFKQFQGIQTTSPEPEETNIIRLRPNTRT